MDFNTEYEQKFTKDIIKYGMFTNLIAIPLCFLPALGLWLVYGALPSLSDILLGWGLIASIFLVYAFIEPISYYPMLGLPGTYMSFLSGNISNMRVPCAAIALETLGAEGGSKKGEIVATLAIAGSIITNLIVVTIAAIGGSALMSIFPKVVLDAFKYVSPAIFGAVFAMYAAKNLKYGVFALTISLILLSIKSLPLYVIIPISIFSTIAFAIISDKSKARTN